MSGLLLDFGFEPDDKARAVPNLYVLAVEELLGLLRRFLIVGTLDNFGRSTDVPGAVYRIDAIRGHVGRSWRQAIRAKAAQRTKPAANIAPTSMAGTRGLSISLCSRLDLIAKPMPLLGFRRFAFRHKCMRIQCRHYGIHARGAGRECPNPSARVSLDAHWLADRHMKVSLGSGSMRCAPQFQP